MAFIGNPTAGPVSKVGSITVSGGSGATTTTTATKTEDTKTETKAEDTKTETKTDDTKAEDTKTTTATKPSTDDKVAEEKTESTDSVDAGDETKTYSSSFVLDLTETDVAKLNANTELKDSLAGSFATSIGVDRTNVEVTIVS